MKKENLKAEKNETLCMGEQRFFFQKICKWEDSDAERK